MTYKGIALTSDMMCWIETYHILDRENLVQYLNDDKVFQKMIDRYKLEIKVYKTLFNFGIWALLYSLSLMIKG